MTSRRQAGRDANHIYPASGHAEPETLLAPTAIDVLTEILERDGSQHSAMTTRREADAPAALLLASVTGYYDALEFAAEQTSRLRGPDA